MPPRKHTNLPTKTTYRENRAHIKLHSIQQITKKQKMQSKSKKPHKHNKGTET